MKIINRNIFELNKSFFEELLKTLKKNDKKDVIMI